jgi:aminopeptidase N
MTPQRGTKATKKVARRILSLMCLLVAVVIAHGATESRENKIDVLHYSVTLEPDIAGKAVKGTVLIQFLITSDNLSYSDFDCGDLAIDSVRVAGAPLQFSVMELEVNYHGTPKRGIRFFPGLRLFTRRNFGKSVITNDFVAAMEEANGKSLEKFFAERVYLQAKIK